MSIRILHAADFHLDSPFDALTEDKAALRRSEQRLLLMRLAETAEQERADIVLLAGDLFDSTAGSGETADALLAMLNNITVPVFIAPGNHDFYSRRSPYAMLPFPDNVHIFTEPRLTSAEVPGLGVRIWGAGYTDRACPPLLSGFSVPKEEKYTDILLLHSDFGKKDSPYSPVTAAELAESGFAYAAFGHIHKGVDVQRAGECFYAWPGCPEGRGFDECGEKGVLLAELGGGTCRADFLPLASRHYERIRVDVGHDALHAVLCAVPEHTERDIYSIILTGETENAPDMLALRSALEGRFFSLTLTDRTELAHDLWERAEEDNMHGRFLRRMRALLEEAEDEERRSLVIAATRLGLAAMDGREVSE